MWWPLADCYDKWLPKRLTNGVLIFILTVSLIVRHRAKIIFELLAMDRSFDSPCEWSWRRSSRCAASSWHRLKRWQVISTKKLKNDKRKCEWMYSNPIKAFCKGKRSINMIKIIVLVFLFSLLTILGSWLHQQNLISSGCLTQSSQTLQ